MTAPAWFLEHVHQAFDAVAEIRKAGAPYVSIALTFDLGDGDLHTVTVASQPPADDEDGS